MMISSCTGALYWTPTRPILSSNWVWFLILVGIESSSQLPPHWLGWHTRPHVLLLITGNVSSSHLENLNTYEKCCPALKSSLWRIRCPQFIFFESLVGPLLTFILRVWENNFQDGCYCFTPKRTPWCISKNHIPA